MTQEIPHGTDKLKCFKIDWYMSAGIRSRARPLDVSALPLEKFVQLEILYQWQELVLIIILFSVD